MANAEHLEVFRQGVTAWNRWRQQHRGLTPDLSGADLQRANFRYANLNDANLEHANLEGANLGRAYLEGAELQGATPRGAHLFSADLRQADMRQADLREAQLWSAHLERADLRDARLSDADLRNSDLTSVDLRGTDLESANLSCANLMRTDLRGARLVAAHLHGARFSACRLDGMDLTAAEAALTAFNAVDLSRTLGLATLRHARPSSIGVDTLECTAAGLEHDGDLRAEVIDFLRAAGVPEIHLELMSDGHAASSYPASVYIVHSLADRGFARRVYGGLQSHGIRCWLHEHAMLPGENLDEGLDLGPRECDGLVLCSSKAALTSWWLAAELDDQRAALLPVHLDGAEAFEAWEKIRALKDRPAAAADFSGWEADEAVFERGLERLVAALRKTRADP